jgi:hypothetical protein
MNGVETFRSTTNQLLLRLPGQEWWRLKPLLRQEELPARLYLERAGSQPNKVYFIESGVISNLERGDVRDPIEVGVIGREGMVGLSTIAGLLPQRDTSADQRSGARARLPAIPRMPYIYPQSAIASLPLHSSADGADQLDGKRRGKGQRPATAGS